MRTSAAILTLLLATSLGAQSSAHAVRGVVFDSIAGTPLKGAVVQVATADAAAAVNRSYSAVSDSTGQFRVDGLAPGHYIIGFQHNVLLALGIGAPVRAFEIAADSVASVDLATPSAAVLRAVRCGSSDALRPGLLAGYVTKARSGAPPAGGIVEISWTEIGVKSRKLTAVPFNVRAEVDEDGSYLACNLTTDAMLSVNITAAGHRTLIGELVVPVNGVMRRDFTLADTGEVVGRTRVSGQVLLADGRPLPSGQAIISALGIDAPVTEGKFSIPGVPAGTWLVDARALGYEPQSALVDVAEGAPATVTIKLTERAQVLAGITVVGKANTKEIRVLTGIQERARMGAGTVFGPGHAALETAMYPADVVRFARGFRYISATEVMGRSQSMLADTPGKTCTGKCTSFTPDSSVIGHTFANEPCTSTREGTKKRYIVLYLDGNQFNGGLDMLNTSIAMKEVLAIEAYPDVASAPPIFRTPDACAILAVWLKH